MASENERLKGELGVGEEEVIANIDVASFGER